MSSKIMKEEEQFNEIGEKDFPFRDQIITYIFIAITIGVGVLAFFSFYDGFSVLQQQKINRYIASADEFLYESEQLMEPLHLYVNEENETRPKVDKELLEVLRDTISAGNALDAPKEFQAHKEAVNEILVERFTAAYAYSLGIQTKKAVMASFEKIEKMKEEEKTSLMESLQQVNLQYDVLEDGKIRIYYKSYKKAHKPV